MTYRFRDCACPGAPHGDGDRITFREALSFKANAAALLAIATTGEAQGAMEVYLYEGPVSWNLVDEEGDPVPLTRAALESLPFADQFAIANHADTLYSETVLSPLVQANAKSSRTGRTTGSSRRSRSSSRTPAR